MHAIIESLENSLLTCTSVGRSVDEEKRYVAEIGGGGGYRVSRGVWGVWRGRRGIWREGGVGAGDVEILKKSGRKKYRKMAKSRAG